MWFLRYASKHTDIYTDMLIARATLSVNCYKEQNNNETNKYQQVQ